MKKNVQQIISIFTLAFFVFIAFGSEDDENTTTETLENTQEIKEDNLTQAQKDSIELVKTKNREKGEEKKKKRKRKEKEKKKRKKKGMIPFRVGRRGNRQGGRR